MRQSKQIKQNTFVARLGERLKESGNKNLQGLDSKDLHDLIWLFFDEITLCLREGHRVIFDGWVSIFTNPVKRKCYDPLPKGQRDGNPRPTSWTYKYRVRFKPLKDFRHQAEQEVSEEEFEEIQVKLAELKEKRKKK